MIADYVRALKAFHSPNVFNPWNDRDALDVPFMEMGGPWARVERLVKHLDCDPSLLLIGEAPGYQGCHFSGVAFTSERLILDGAIPRVSATSRLTTRPLPWSEPSATIVWKALSALGVAEQTVLWNSFAWHPHRPDEPMSNRAPTLDELMTGLPVLKMVLAMFPRARVVTVGKMAGGALRALGVTPHGCVRHPANGGATLFREQLAALVGALPIRAHATMTMD